MNRVNLSFAILSLLVSVPALGQPSRQAVLDALRGYEIPMTRERLESLGAGWEQVLEQLAQDPSLVPLYRIRAVGALAFSKSPTTPAVLRAVLARHGKAERGPAAIEAKAAVSALGLVEGANALDLLAGFLDHPVPDTRIAAAQALSAIASPKVPALLRKRLAVEVEPVAKAGLEQALQTATR